MLAEHPAEVRKLEAQLAALTKSSGAEKIETTPVDERTLAQLKSLGYTSGFAPRSYRLDGAGANPKDRVTVLKLMDTAEALDSPLDAAQRIELLKTALRQDPTNPLLYYSLGSKLERAGRFDEAMRLYRSAIEKGIENGRLHSRLGDLLVRSGKKAEAIAEYEKAMRLNPGDAASQANMATAYLEVGRLDDAERTFQAVAAVDPGSAAAQNGLGLVAIQRQDGTGARMHFEKAVELDPELVEAQLNLGLLYKMAGERERARAAFEQFLAKASPQKYGEVIPKVKAELAALR